ncbi:LOW QUALITY PROTEIN: rho GTPase-activating protein 30 [Acridotheres tristis]
MSRALKARHRARRKGGSRERLFGCDLREHLQRSGQDVPQVLRSCTEFVEQHGVVDGIYRLSGVSSNIQRLRQEFEAQRSPDLSRDVYLQDVHCVSSLCKAYCRELPNPLLTYQLYDKFADAVAIQMEEARLVKIKEVLKELPEPHYRTLEFLMRHLLRMAAHSGRTNMHARNLAIVWAPNLLRSRDIEAAGFNGTAAFMEVRVQSIVVEFILTHVEQLFGDAPLAGADSPRRSLLLPGGAPPPHVPAVLSQGDGPPQMRPYHTIIELGEHRSKGSLKAKKWRSIFNLGRSGHEAKRKPGKVEEKDKCGKVTLRPAKSMDSLSSSPLRTAREGSWGQGRNGGKSLCIPNPPRTPGSPPHPGIPPYPGIPPSPGDPPFPGIPPHPGIPPYPGIPPLTPGSPLSPRDPPSPGDPPAPRARSGRAPPSAGADTARLLPKLSVKLRPQRQHSSDAAPAAPELDESLEEVLEAAAESSTQSEPTSPKAPREGPGVCGRSRAEKCAGLHISGPFSVTVPFHITSNLSRLTRGLPCPALEREAPPGSAPEPARDPRPLSGDAEQTRLSLELRDSFAFLDCHETWLEGGGGHGGGGAEPRGRGMGPPGWRMGPLGSRMGPSASKMRPLESWMGHSGSRMAPPGIEEGLPAVEEGMESGFMNPGELWAEQPDNYLSIEECTEQDMFFLAPGDPDSDPDEIFLSAHDDLSPLGAAPDTPEGTPGRGDSPGDPGDPGDPRHSRDPRDPQNPRDPRDPKDPESPGDPRSPPKSQRSQIFWPKQPWKRMVREWRTPMGKGVEGRGLRRGIPGI